MLTKIKNINITVKIFWIYGSLQYLIKYVIILYKNNYFYYLKKIVEFLFKK